MKDHMTVSTLYKALSMLIDNGMEDQPVVVKTNSYTYPKEYPIDNVSIKMDNDICKLIVDVTLIQETENEL